MKIFKLLTILVSFLFIVFFTPHTSFALNCDDIKNCQDDSNCGANEYCNKGSICSDNACPVLPTPGAGCSNMIAQWNCVPNTNPSSSSSSSSFVACDLRTTSIACTSTECAWYDCSLSCHPRGTTGCAAGCSSYCRFASSSSSVASSSSSSTQSSLSSRSSSISSGAACEKTKGDANCDGKIELADYSIWLMEFKRKCGVGAVVDAARCQEDADNNGSLMDADFNNLNGVTLADYGIWYANWPGK